ncbi:MAG TPA: hypothetical protein VJ937_15380 [Salinivirga sp.]|uniref:hypothetical protein n=1 Tax=Salinivirga sp. TaxID=1970192 RepID=UPI002B49B9C4|nr:hypothetical protein [Salinivirga sp.]HKK60862.1 hypothetical protein [Salinivirga sp.]
MKVLILFLFLVLLAKFSLSQNITLSDDESYEAHSSAMVDIYSKTKGLLVPRVTNTEMNSIATPANGLIVYNSSFNNYYYWDGADWKIVAVSEYFQSNGDTVFITGDGKRFGIGTRSPMGRLTVMGDSTATSDEPLFEVKNSQGEIIFAVYENEVQVNFKEDSSKALKGGFAVGGLTSGKSEPTEYLRITPDSVRIYIDDSSTKAQKGGFAVGGLTSGKANHNKYFLLNQDSTRIYHKTGLKAQKGGFAVGGLTGGKSIPENYLTVERDSTRIYVNENAKAQKGGFAVGGLTGGKGGAQFLNLTKDNYLIGHRAGDSITSGYKNFYAGYEAGMGNKDGFYNVAIGYQAGRLNNSASNVFIGTYAGLNNVDGWSNVFIGNRSGFNNKGLASGGYRNVFIGREAGYENVEGLDNIYVGAFAGSGISDGSDNVMIGTTSGSHGATGSQNVYLGNRAGYANEGSNNVFLGDNAGGNGGDYSTPSSISGSIMIGHRAGYNNTAGTGNVFMGYRAGYNEAGSNKLYIENSSADANSALIYGDFSLDRLRFNAEVGVGSVSVPNVQFQINSETTQDPFRVQVNGSTKLFVGKDGGVTIGTFNNTPPDDGLYVYGNVGIGVASPAEKLQINGNIVPLYDQNSNLGTASLQWNNVYGTNWLKSNGKIYTGIKLSDDIVSHPLKESAEKAGFLDISSLPKSLTIGNAMLTGEMAIYNYQLNFEQQTLINELKAEIRHLKETLQNKNQQIEGLKHDNKSPDQYDQTINQLMRKMNKMEQRIADLEAK